MCSFSPNLTKPLLSWAVGVWIKNQEEAFMTSLFSMSFSVLMIMTIDRQHDASKKESQDRKK